MEPYTDGFYSFFKGEHINPYQPCDRLNWLEWHVGFLTAEVSLHDKEIVFTKEHVESMLRKDA